MGDGIEPSLLPRIDKITLQRNIRNWTSGKLWNSIILPASCCFYLLGRHSFQQPGPGLPRSPRLPRSCTALLMATKLLTTWLPSAWCICWWSGSGGEYQVEPLLDGGTAFSIYGWSTWCCLSRSSLESGLFGRNQIWPCHAATYLFQLSISSKF